MGKEGTRKTKAENGPCGGSEAFVVRMENVGEEVYPEAGKVPGAYPSNVLWVPSTFGSPQKQLPGTLLSAMHTWKSEALIIKV